MIAFWCQNTFCSFLWNHVVPENIHTPPTEGIEISWGLGDSVRPKHLKKCMKFNWNFQRGGGGGWIFLWNLTFRQISENSFRPPSTSILSYSKKNNYAEKKQYLERLNYIN